MKSSSTPQDVSEDEDTESTRTGAPTRPGENGHSRTQSRPSLVRSPLGRLSDISQKLVEGQHTQQGEESSSGSDGTESSDTSSAGDEKGVNDGSKRSKSLDDSRSEEERLAKLRDAVNAKLLLQQRMRRSFGSSRADPGGSNRISPIKEEDAMQGSPTSINAAVAGSAPGIRTSSTVSTASTESAKTVRAGVPATPAGNLPVRTPSYPFPYVPGTPRTWSSNFHQPFMTLSPTVTSGPQDEHDTPGNKSSVSLLSGESTPAADNTTFLPPGSMNQAAEDPRFPTPNLYNMVLQLNAEPGWEPWWATVTNLMHDNFKADRVTLVMPQDPTDIENVPWGQKATFSMNGPEEFVPHRTVMEQTSHAAAQQTSPIRPDFVSRDSSTVMASDIKPQKLHPERLRPRFEARHSYAGHGRDAKEVSNPIPTRPIGPKRTATHAAGMELPSAATGRMPARRFSLTTSVRQDSTGDPDFSSVAGDIDAGPYAEVFPTLRNLDHEVRPLIEPGGVIRVLDRGRVVTVTRDYVPDNPSNADDAKNILGEPQPTIDPRAFSKLFGNYRSVFASDNAPSLSRDYEEYEQHPTSPWSQSPAPSPAIHADEETNPFFASGEQQVEDSFNPATTPKDYSQLGQVGAIGVDHASTVIHIPLVHPTMSQPMQSLKTYPQPKDRPGPPQRSNTVDMERKAPIAILSILSSTVPYPHNLTQSLKLLGAHLATSFAIAQQFSSTHSQAISIRHRRTASGHHVSDAPMTIEPTSLEDIVNTDLEEPPGSISGSVTSPSDYSGRSKHSPASSIVGTPGWDPSTHGWASSKSVSGTSALTGTEMIDNYFEAKKRSGQRSGSNAGAQVQNLTPSRPQQKVASSESKPNAHKPSPPHDGESKHDTFGAKAPVKEEKSPLRSRSSKEHSPPRSAGLITPQRPAMRHSVSGFADSSVDRRHSQLHSYGADLHASFGGLPSASLVDPHPPSPYGHARKPSYPEDMPPPSERLLRTIIDSVPVQIFTAEPDTGKLTWVNSKFLIYRGQEPRQVLNDPWQAMRPKDRHVFLETWYRSLRTGQQLQQKVELERFDGSYRWFYVRAAPLKDKKQKIVHWIGTMMDFHEQHMAELNSARQQETAASEAKYRALANSSPQIVFAVNKTKGVIFCNTQWLHYSGQTEAQALELGFMDHVHPDDLAKCKLPTFEDDSVHPTNVPTSVPPEFKRKTSGASSSGSSETEKGVSSTDSSPLTSQMPQRKLSELASTGILKIARDADGRPSYSTEVRLKAKEGEYRWHLVRVLLAEPLLQSGTDEETWYGTCTDINDHKTLERDLKETMDEKSRFLSNMSHEIRTPLNGITGMVNFLIDSSLTDEQMEHVNIIRASTEGLRGLINDILDLSKAEAGMIQLNLDWLYVRALIEEVNDLTSAMAIDKGLELNYLVEEDVPAQIKGDRFRMRQILLNIIGNAIKFTPKGEVFVRCRAQQPKDNELAKNELYIRFEVIDTGRGFTDKEAEYLFKRFSQIDGSSTRQHGGTGLGLVISRQLAQLHGGDMSAKGVPGKGANFTFTIKTTLPSRFDQPPPMPQTPGGVNIPVLPISPGQTSSPAATPIPKVARMPSIPMPTDTQPRPSPKFTLEQFQSPSPYGSPDVGRESPSVSSSSSNPSLRSAARTSSLRSERSSASSFMPDPSVSSPPIKLSLPPESRLSRSETAESLSTDSSGSGTSAKTVTGSPANLVSSGATLLPPMYSILVLCPLKYSREATVQHIDMTLPKNIPHQITAREHLIECQKMIGGEDPVIFTHIVVVLQDVGEIVALLDQVLSSSAHHATTIVIITDLAQRRKIVEQAPRYDFEQLIAQRRLRVVFKPLKPSRFAIIFDPRKEREMSTDRNQDSAQQVALTQKQVFDDLTRRLGNQDKRVLLVEDNKVNQMVST